MTKTDHFNYAKRAIPVALLMVSYGITANSIVAAFACVAALIWIIDLILNTGLDDVVCTWWVGDGHGNGIMVVAKTADEAIAKCAMQTFDLRAELVGEGEIP